MFKERIVTMKFEDYNRQDLSLTDDAEQVITVRLARMSLGQMMVGLKKGENVEFVFGMKLGSDRPPGSDEASAAECRECIMDTLPEDFDYVWSMLNELGVIEDGLEVNEVYEIDDVTGEELD